MRLSAAQAGKPQKARSSASCGGRVASACASRNAATASCVRNARLRTGNRAGQRRRRTGAAQRDRPCPLPWSSAATSTPQKVSPAPVVSTGRTGKAGCTRCSPSTRAQQPRAPSVTTTTGTCSCCNPSAMRALPAGDAGQFALVDDQDVDMAQQVGVQCLRGRGVEHHPHARGARRPGIGRDGGQAVSRAASAHG